MNAQESLGVFTNALEGTLKTLTCGTCGSCEAKNTQAKVNEMKEPVLYFDTEAEMRERVDGMEELKTILDLKLGGPEREGETSNIAPELKIARLKKELKESRDECTKSKIFCEELRRRIADWEEIVQTRTDACENTEKVCASTVAELKKNMATKLADLSAKREKAESLFASSISDMQANMAFVSSSTEKERQATAATYQNLQDLYNERTAALNKKLITEIDAREKKEEELKKLAAELQFHQDLHDSQMKALEVKSRVDKSIALGDLNASKDKKLDELTVAFTNLKDLYDEKNRFLHERERTIAKLESERGSIQKIVKLGFGVAGEQVKHVGGRGRSLVREARSRSRSMTRGMRSISRLKSRDRGEARETRSKSRQKNRDSKGANTEREEPDPNLVE